MHLLFFFLVSWFPHLSPTSLIGLSAWIGDWIWHHEEADLWRNQPTDRFPNKSLKSLKTQVLGIESQFFKCVCCLQLEVNILRLYDRVILGFSDDSSGEIFKKYEVSTLSCWRVVILQCIPSCVSVKICLSWNILKGATIGVVFDTFLFVFFPRKRQITKSAKAFFSWRRSWRTLQ